MYPIISKHTVCEVSQLSHDCLRWTQHDQNSWRIYVIWKQSKYYDNIVCDTIVTLDRTIYCEQRFALIFILWALSPGGRIKH